MKIIIEGSAEEINGILEALRTKKSAKKETKTPVKTFKFRYGNNNLAGLRINNQFYTFEKDDMWRHLGEELIVKNYTVFDKAGNNLGKLIRI